LPSALFRHSLSKSSRPKELNSSDVIGKEPVGTGQNHPHPPSDDPIQAATAWIARFLKARFQEPHRDIINHLMGKG